MPILFGAKSWFSFYPQKVEKAWKILYNNIVVKKLKFKDVINI
jgi:hypothetical protein